MLGIVNEVAPVAMFVRPGTRDNGRNAGRAISEYGSEPSTVRGQRASKGIVANDFPSAGVYENKEREDGFHRGCSFTAIRKVRSSNKESLSRLRAACAFIAIRPLCLSLAPLESGLLPWGAAWGTAGSDSNSLKVEMRLAFKASA